MNTYTYKRYLYFKSEDLQEIIDKLNKTCEITDEYDISTTIIHKYISEKESSIIVELESYMPIAKEVMENITSLTPPETYKKHK